MSVDIPLTGKSIDNCLKELGKEFRRLSGKTTPAEIILIGGAAVLLNYGFRDVTYDIDAVVNASSAMKEAANHVGDKLGLQNGWLNMDFKKTKSYSEKLIQISVYHKTYSNVLTVRAVAAEYLVAMKLMSGRKYKYDLSDVAGILSEHEKSGKPISRSDIDRAMKELYGGWRDVPESSIELIDTAFASGDYQKAYQETRLNEVEAKEILLDFDKDYPGALTADNLNEVLSEARQKQKKQEEKI